jgi:type 1 glutamine amidotransferase
MFPALLRGDELPSTGKAVRVLLLSGQNNHHWQRTTGLLKQTLDTVPFFETEVVFSPPSKSAPEAWADWDPGFHKYDVVLNNYFGEMWPGAVQESFLSFVREGGGVLNVHAANNAFNGWKDYELMVGLLWRGNDYGWGLYLDDQGREHHIPPGEGPGAGHGGLHDWVITTRDPDHPVFSGLPGQWLHAHDELYHGQRGPSANINLLATAWSSKESGGTGRHEPQIWWVPYGRGRVLTFLPGHIWPGQRDDSAFRCAGFQTVLIRSIEWLGTGSVSWPVPDDFPTADKVSVRPAR